MNAAGMTFVLNGVSGVLAMPFYQSLVTDGSISQGELDGTRRNLSAVISTLRKTPPEKIEAMVDQYNQELTEHFDKFRAVGQMDCLSGFQTAQIMAGYVTTVMAKSGLNV
jgi:ribosomal protein S17E